MGIRNLVNNYAECNEFELKLKEGKINIYYYDKIVNFLNNKISVIKDDKRYDIEGKNLNISTMYQELLIITGIIEKISIGTFYEKSH